MYTGVNQPPLNSYIPLQPKAALSYQKMKSAALKDNIEINLISGYRSFKTQLILWNRKFDFYQKQNYSTKDTIYKILKYTAIPGTSRHHWGTDIDIIGPKKYLKDPLNLKHFIINGVYYKLYRWLNNNSYKFGYIITYNNHKNRSGFLFEPWHYSYKPISKYIFYCYLRKNWLECVNYKEIRGHEYFDDNFIKQYFIKHIFGIDKQLL